MLSGFLMSIFLLEEGQVTKSFSLWLYVITSKVSVVVVTCNIS
jgi:hypothetical protein